MPATKKRRAPKRHLVPRPVPLHDDDVVSELISVVKCSLTSITRDRRVMALIEWVVVTVNEMGQRLSMLAKELCLTLLQAGEPLPKLTHNFFSKLYTSMWKGTWTHGHADLLQRRCVPKPSTTGVMGTVLRQAMSLMAKKMAAEVETHYRHHYERFYRRWKKGSEQHKTIKIEDETCSYYLDPEKTILNTLIVSAWKMRKDLEDWDERGFALFPERKVALSYITLDATCLAGLYKTIYPDCFRTEGKRPGTTKAKPLPDATHDHSAFMFGLLFDLKRVRSLRKNHHFRFSLQTDGRGVSLSFGRWVHSLKKGKSERKKKKAKTVASARAVNDLVPGYAYSYHNKTLRSLTDLQGTTVRAVDPGVHRTFTAVDLLTDDDDVRRTTMIMRSRSWYQDTRSKQYGRTLGRWRKKQLGSVQRELNTVPFRRSACPKKYRRYVDTVFQHYSALWSFARQPKVRKLRFRRDIDHQKALDRAVNRLCRPRPGDRQTLLIYGNGAKTNLFGRIKRNVKGPAKKLFDVAQRRKAAITVWADEFRTSKLGLHGQAMIHPQERRPDRLRSRPCRADQHGPDNVRGCSCFCRQKGCQRASRVKGYCLHHQKIHFQHDVCYQHPGHQQHKHRLWNRDVVAAINIGCLFLARALGLNLGLWQRGTVLRTSPSTFNPLTLSWAEIFGQRDLSTPFSIPMTTPITA